MPTLDKMTSEEHINISKKMFYGGFAFLPLLWLVNFLYFFSACRQPEAPKQLKKCKLTSKHSLKANGRSLISCLAL